MKIFTKFKFWSWKTLFLAFVFLSSIYAVKNNFPIPEIVPNETDTTRIVFVPGIKTWDFYLWGWKHDLREKFPNAEIIFLEDVFYMHFQPEKTNQIVEQGVEILNDGEPTKIIAHSFGGILARAMAEQAQNANIEKFITMASPHEMTLWGVKGAKEKLNLSTDTLEKLDRKTFGGYLDPMVPYIWTNLKESQHEDLWSEHLGFLLFKKFRARVLEFL